VWGDSGRDVFVGGYEGSYQLASPAGQPGTIQHNDGSAWSPMSSPAVDWLSTIWGSSGSDVFAVGSGGTILHYDGSAWSPMTPSP
jgi:hypothetical protein